MLLEQLQANDRSDAYPFHMPGHKRRMELGTDAYHLDITEIDGFDNLHHAQGILKEEQARYADYIGVNRSFFLVNGSTCGILAAISAAVPRGGKLLMARNSHKAAYHALFLRQLRAHYLYPCITGFDIQGAISPDQVKKALEDDPEIAAVYVTSPTYDGVVSDVKAIADLVHEHGKTLIVDEAHGAHFGFHPAFPPSAAGCGADVVIQSVHKTLPAFTQSAVMHLCSDRISADVLEQFLDIYESSSPSYVLMAGISRLVPFLQSEGAARFSELAKNLEQFYEKTKKLSCLHVIREGNLSRSEAFLRDPSKILISTKNCNINGRQLYERLLEEFHLQLEMYSGEYVTALCSLMDQAEGFERLADALIAIDAAICRLSKEDQPFVARMYREREQVCSIADAMEQETEALPWQKAEGRISGEYVYLYPPGIPILVPGERIDARVICDIEEIRARGMLSEGLRDMQARSIHVISFYNNCID